MGKIHEMKNYIFCAILICISLFSKSFAQTQIWDETFDIAEKGYWGGGSDLTGITKWSLNATNCTLADVDDFIKTVSTGGGRMQAQDIDGEAVWTSEAIAISSFIDVSITVDVSEVGSSTSTSKYIKVYYSIDGGAETIFETNGENIGNFGVLTATQSGINGNSLQIIIRINNPNAGDGTIFDNIVVEGNVPSNDNDSELSNGLALEPSTISSIQNDNSNPYQVLDFTLTDAGSGDGLATLINQLSITPGTNNTITDWQTAIEGTKLFGPDIAAEGISGTLSATSITFSGSPIISVGDGSSETYQLKVYLKTDLSSINDNDVFDFEVDYGNIITGTAGSSFGTGTVSSGAILLSVDASELRFQTTPVSIYTNHDFSAIIEATDVNGNLDADFSSQVTLSLNSGSGNLSAVLGLSKNATSGVTNWTDIQYDTEETFSLLATTTGLTNNSVNSAIIVAKVATSELFDDFEDGDLAGWENTSDWANSTLEPINGTHSLKHNLSDVTGNSYLSHNLAGLDLNTKSVVWRFNLKNGDWDPSGTNKFWFYLLANESDLTSSTIDGYAVGVDLSGTDDLLTLWKVTDGAAEQALIVSDFDWNNSELIGIEVIRSMSGEWSLSYYNNSNFENAQIAGSATNADYTFTDYCGLVFSFGTASRAGFLWMDDLSISLDNNPPQVSSVTAIDANTLQIQFSEKVNQIIAENINNYSIDGFEAPNSAVLSVDGTMLTLIYSSDFAANQTYSITISNMEDISGNLMSESSYDFKYIPFVIENLYVLSQTELMLEFTHPLEQTSAETLTNYLVDNSIGNPLSATLVKDSMVQLTFSSFSKGVDYLLNIANVKNENGKSIDATNISFSYYPGGIFDLIINELMVDIGPSPAVLPAAKYIELFNRSQTDLDLSGWRLQVGDNALRDFENNILKANEYLIICAPGNKESFQTFGNTMGILSESQLTGSGTSIVLYNKENQLVEYVNYSDNWYNADSKKEGGWSLERIDAENFCGAANNWRASEDYKGGTPGKENSVIKDNTDNIPFELLQVKVLSSNKLAVTFSKNITESTALNTANYQLDEGANPILFAQFSDTSRTTIILQFQDNFTDAQEQEIHIAGLMDFCENAINATRGKFTYYLISAREAFADSEKFIRLIFSEEVEINSAQTVANYQVSDGIGSPIAAYKHSERTNEVFLEFPVEFLNGNGYTLSVENVTDLNGNAIKPIELSFTYFVPSSNDLIINELLFNPKPKGVDFVEIYNKAILPVDLSKISLARRSDEGEIESKKQLSEFNKMLSPGVFLAISTDTVKTKRDYPAASYDQFLQIPILPSYNDDEGTVVLLYGDTIIDEFSYTEKMHFALITDNEGVSLERIDPLKRTGDQDNWHSAASTVGFATPGNQNSQFRQLADGIDEKVKIEPETFSPDNDGYEDVVFIRYKFNEPGYVANVSIYDAKGRLVKRIANTKLLATEGEFSWDGLHENQTKARIGIYVIYFEVFNLQGVVKKTKKTCVLAGKLN